MYARLRPYEQRHFIDEVMRLTGHSKQELANLCGVVGETLAGWYKEEHPMPYLALLHLSEISGVPIPKIQDFSIISVRSGPSKTVDKQLLSPDLAEFIGIMLGDGGIQENTVTVYLNLYQEAEYAQFVADLAFSLFDIKAAMYPDEKRSVLKVGLNSVKLAKHLQDLGLVIGSKVRQQCGIPDWIFEDIEFVRACVRGMMDTDGCVYHHAYISNGKEYQYVKMTYAGRSWPLMEGLQRMLQMLGYKPGRIRKPGYMSISSDRAVRRYYEQDVGTHNPHHWQRYQEAVAKIREHRIWG